jgi:branched-chain amino acid transport system substrate-binding protein
MPFSVARAQPSDTIRIGVLTDLSGPYRDVTGPTSVACARLAVEEFTQAHPDIKVELIAADHMNKADVGVSIVREWFDRGDVDVVTDIGNSAVAIALSAVCSEKDKIQLNTAAGSSELTGKRCSANLIHWSYDTWCFAHAIGDALTRAGGSTWYFVTADYAFGHAIQTDTTRFIEAAGGKVVGASAYPFPGTTDFSSYLLAAQSSGAKVLAFANAGDDFINCVKQANEFGVTKGGVKVAGIINSITVVVAAGLPVMQGLTVSETFYWDLNERTRAFMARVRPRLPAGVFPTYTHAGAYAAVSHYLKVVREMGVAKAKTSGRETIAAMKAMPTDDDCFGKGLIRADGRKIHPAYLFEVKTPAESRYPGDVYRLTSTIPIDKAFRPMNEGGCSLVPA